MLPINEITHHDNAILQLTNIIRAMDYYGESSEKKSYYEKRIKYHQDERNLALQRNQQ